MITLAQVKTYLGITANTYDALITAMIPIAEAKYREIAGYNFNWMIYATFADGATTMEIGGVDYAINYGDAFINSQPGRDSAIWQLNYGDLIEGAGVPAGTYITAIDTIENEVTVSAAFTADGDRIRITTNISYYPVISSLIWFMVGQQSTTAQDKSNISSQTLGSMSITYDNSNISKRYGVPEKIVSAIPKYAGVY